MAHVTSTSKSRNAIDGRTIRVRKGLVVYKVKASPYYRARVSIPQQPRLTRTTKATSRIDAIEAAEEWFASLGANGLLANPPKEKTFEHFSDRLLEDEKSRGERGLVHPRLWRSTRFYLRHADWGLLRRFSGRDVTVLRTNDYTAYTNWVKQTAPHLTPAR